MGKAAWDNHVSKIRSMGLATLRPSWNSKGGRGITLRMRSIYWGLTLLLIMFS